MKKIATIALAALENKQKTLSEFGWGEKYNDLYKCWVEMRRQNGHKIHSKNEWRDTINALINDLKGDYLVGGNDRYRSWETGNVLVSVHIMCGSKKFPQWETSVTVAIVDHA